MRSLFIAHSARIFVPCWKWLAATLEGIRPLSFSLLVINLNLVTKNIEVYVIESASCFSMYCICCIACFSEFTVLSHLIYNLFWYIDSHVEGVNGLAFSYPNKQLCIYLWIWKNNKGLTWNSILCKVQGLETFRLIKPGWCKRYGMLLLVLSSILLKVTKQSYSVCSHSKKTFMYELFVVILIFFNMNGRVLFFMEIDFVDMMIPQAKALY